MKNRILFFAVVHLLTINTSFAQFNLYVDYQGIYDDNIFNNSQPISDFINNFSLGSAVNFESEFNNVQIYYEGSLNYFRETTSKSYNSHRIGIVETHLFDIDDNPLNAGLNYSFRNNKDDFKIYDFNQISAYVNYRHSISETDFILPGYVYNRNEYKNFTLFSHHEHKLFFTWISNFETETSLTLNTELNLKKYFEQYDYEDYLNQASQLKFLINLGQSLGERTGMNGYAVIRKNLTDGSRYLLSDSLIYYEEEIFNDIYSYDGIEAGIGLKHLLSDYFELSLEGKYLMRNYVSLPAADINGTELSSLREDKLFGFGAGLNVDLSEMIEGLSFSGSWNYYKNSSNDYYYKYTNQVISASFNYGL
jgi:hypothetical protein